MSVRRSVASMAAATVASRFLGFIRVVIISAIIGTTALGNTFQSTNSISNVLFDLLAAGALSAALVPQLVHAMARSEIELKKMVSSLISLVVIILGVISIVGVLCAHPISESLFSRAPGATHDAQVRTGTILLRFFMPQIVLYGFGAVAIAVLTAKKKFIAIVVAPIGGSLFIMAAIIVFHFVHDTSGVVLPLRDTIILGIAGTGACLAFIAIPVVVAFRQGIVLLPSKDIKSGLSVLSSSLWAIAIQSAAAIILGVTIFIGNNRNGAVVAYQLAFVFFLAPYAIISESFSTVLLPDLSHTALKEKENSEFSGIVSNMMTWTYRPMAVIAGVCIALCEPVSKILSEGKAHSGQGMVAIIFAMLALGIVPYSVFQAAARVYFAKSNIRLPALTILISSIVLSGAAFVGSRYTSGNGLVVIMGLAHTLAYAVAAIALLYLLHKDKYKVMPDKISWLIVAASTIYGAIGVVITHAFDLDGRATSIAYCIAYVFVSAAIILIVTPQKQRRKIRALLSEISLKKQVPMPDALAEIEAN